MCFRVGFVVALSSALVVVCIVVLCFGCRMLWLWSVVVVLCACVVVIWSRFRRRISSASVAYRLLAIAVVCLRRCLLCSLACVGRWSLPLITIRWELNLDVLPGKETNGNRLTRGSQKEKIIITDRGRGRRVRVAWEDGGLAPKVNYYSAKWIRHRWTLSLDGIH